MKKKEIKQQIDALKTLTTDLTERVESLEKELGLKYVTKWEETMYESPTEEILPLFKPVKQHVKEEPIKWERFSPLPFVAEGEKNERSV